MGATPERTLVTGASGRIGRAIHELLSRDREVIGLDTVPSPTADLVGDICDLAVIRQALDGVRAVVHTAALHAPHVGHVSPQRFQRVNVDATRVLAALAVEAGVEVFIFTSTTALFGEASAPVHEAGWLTEATDPRPRTVYHRSKWEAEANLAAVSRESGMRVAILRVSRCFPEPAPVMAVYRLHRGIDARDIAAGHARALAVSPPGASTFILSGETPFRPGDAVRLKVDAPSVLRRRAPRLAQVFAQRGWPLPRSIDRVYDASKARAELGWRTRYGFEEVIRLLDADSPEVLMPGG
jgi:UDP-glucose 4-epimerase